MSPKILTALAAPLLLSSPLLAADLFWDATPGTPDGTSQGGAGTWDTSTGNWDDGGAYQTWNNVTNATDTAVFAGTAGIVTIDAGGITAGSINVTGGYTLDGGVLTLTGGTGIIKNGSGTLTITNTNGITGDVFINGGVLQLASNGGTGSLNGSSYGGNIFIASGSTYRDRSNTSVTMSGVISGAGNFHQDGSGTITLTGANTYTGKTIIAASGAGGPSLSISSFNSVNGGTPLMASSSLGAPTTVANGTIQLGSGSNVRNCTLIYTGSGETTDRVMNVRFNSGSDHTISNTGSGLLTFTSNFQITPSSGTTGSTLRLRGSGDGNIAQIGTIPGLIEKLDAGTWTVGGTNGANALTVSGGTLVNNGTMNITTAVTVGASDTLSAGYMITDSMSLNATSTLIMELGGTTLGTEYDNVDLTTAMTYGGVLQIADIGAFDIDAASQVYDLFALNSASASGDFASVTVNGISLTNSSGTWTGVNGDASYSFSQSSGDLAVTVIPEPSVAILGSLGLLCLLRRRR